VQDAHVSLAHGNGGRYMRELIAEIFVRHLGNPELDADADAVPVTLGEGEIMLTTDGFTVQPLEFPGGNIGSLAVHGIVNDLAVSGATPIYLTLSAIIEEGLPFEQLERIIAALGEAARSANVRVVAGVGGSIEWSVRPIAAKRVVGMWHETHRLPALPGAWWPWATGSSTVFLWQGRHDRFDSAFSNRGRPLALWQWLQSSLPWATHGLFSQEVNV